MTGQLYDIDAFKDNFAGLDMVFGTNYLRLTR